MPNSDLIPTDVIDGIWPFLQSIDWRDPWLALLLTFHVAVTMTALMTRNHANFQILLFLVLLLLVYFSENINEVAASNWINISIPKASWLYQSSQLMTSLKRAQLRQQARIRQGVGGGDSNAVNPTAPVKKLKPKEE
ncbi:hypothetical protein PV326_008815 [Microctonus aethiopoides]|nr:hypothetical protein PV326_008815 [Microctonus aethiopoides]